MPTDISALDWTLRLGVAALLSGLVGFEREAKQKAAGLRTHMLVGLGAALFTLVGAFGFAGGDPARVAAQIVTGVGFLGAGAIFRDGATVRGLTTAAGLWGVAAIGMTTGAGLIQGAVIATVIALVVLQFLGLTERTMRARRARGTTRTLGVVVSDLGELKKVVKLVSALDEEARHVGVDQWEGDNFMLTFQVRRERIATVVAAVHTLEAVVHATEMDPD